MPSFRRRASFGTVAAGVARDEDAVHSRRGFRLREYSYAYSSRNEEVISGKHLEFEVATATFAADTLEH